MGGSHEHRPWAFIDLSFALWQAILPRVNHEEISNLIALVDRWRSPRVVVVGDFMLDRQSYGAAERLAPDAPVPVLRVEREEHTPGGAANVSLCLAALRCEVHAVGLIGDDAAGRQLQLSLRDKGVHADGLVAATDRPTTVKQSLVGLAQHRHPQKMFRLDIESHGEPTPDLEKQLAERAEALLEGADALCLEDYGKGVLTEALCRRLIDEAKRRGVPVLVDPAARDDFSRYRGATCLTPNRTEAERASGATVSSEAAAIASLGAALQESLALEVLVLTLDRQGAMLFEGDAPPMVVPTRARSVYDVTGAGDMVLAMLAAAVSNGSTWPQAVALANVAAGLEVERFGVVCIELDEVLLALLEEQGAAAGKVRTTEALLAELAVHRRQGKTIGFTNGCFDVLHAGHVTYLRAAATEADLLVVAVNTDDSIRRIKGPDRPLNHQDDRLLVLSELESVDYLVLFDSDTPIELITALEPDVLIKGADYQKHEVVGHDVVEARGGRVALIPLVEGRSTTNLIQRARGGNRDG